MPTAAEALADFIRRHAELNDPASSLTQDTRLHWWNLGWVAMVERDSGSHAWRVTALGLRLLAADSEADRDQLMSDAFAELKSRLSDFGTLQPDDEPPTGAG